MLTVFLKLHLSVLIAGFTGLFGRLISLDAFWIVLFRLIIGGAFLFGYLVLIGKLKPIGPRGIIRGLLMGALLSSHLMLFYVAIKLSNVSIGVVTVSTIGFFVAFIEPAIFHSRFSLTDVGFSLLAICGVLFIFGFDSRYRLGISVGIVCSLVAGVYSILNRKIASLYDNFTLMAWQCVGGVSFMLLLLPAYYLLAGDWNLHFDPFDALYLFMAGTVCTAGLYILQLQVLQRLSAFTVMLTYNLEPVYSIIMAMLIFDEAAELNYSFYIGICFIICSVCLKTLKSLRLKQQNGTAD
ncbi:MAG: DMT family transporter [Succinivibrio sp.]|nr:DMT family transporter [Succinivibrio sp.]